MNYKNTDRQQTKLEKNEFLSTHPARQIVLFCQLPIEMMPYKMTKYLAYLA